MASSRRISPERLLELARLIVRDPDAPPLLVIAAAWLTIHGREGPLLGYVEEASR